MRLRVAIVDDEDLARAVVREYLAGMADVEVVAECANGFEAVKAVSELQPDVLILDVQMPKLNGFEVLELVGRDVAVVFVTAFDQYAHPRVRSTRRRLSVEAVQRRSPCRRGRSRARTARSRRRVAGEGTGRGGSIRAGTTPGASSCATVRASTCCRSRRSTTSRRRTTTSAFAARGRNI